MECVFFFASQTASSDGLASPLQLSDTDVDFGKDTVANLYCHEQLTDDLPTGTLSSSADILHEDDDMDEPIQSSSNRIASVSTVSIVRRSSSALHTKRSSRKLMRPIKNRHLQQCTADDASALQLLINSATCVEDENNDNWTAKRTCCGLVYEHRLIGAVLLDAKQWRRDSCTVHGANGHSLLMVVESQDLSASTTTTVLTKTTGSNSSASLSDNILASGGPTIVSSAGGRKIKLTTNAIQFLKRASVVSNGRSVVSTSEESIAKTATTPAATRGMLGKIITIKTGSVIAASVATAGTPATAANPPTAPVSAVATEANGHKFNDNSSDSGYDEAMLQEPNGVSFVDAIVT